jgi:hypothetical protein
MISIAPMVAGRSSALIAGVHLVRPAAAPPLPIVWQDAKTDKSGGLALSVGKATPRDLELDGTDLLNAMMRGAIGLLALILAACSAPNLDETVVGEPASSIREGIADHGQWDEALSDEQLDHVAGFIAEYAGAAQGGPAAGAPGLKVWTDHACGTCHALAAAGPGD